MAWYVDSLQKIQKAIDKNEWGKVAELLEEHHTTEIKSAITETDTLVSKYTEDITQISEIISSSYHKKHPEQIQSYKDMMELKIDSALQSAIKFEKILLLLIKKGKFS